MNVIVRPVHPGDKFSSFALGTKEGQPLKTFLKRHALRYEEQSVARTYVIVDEDHRETPGRVWGYITLVASQVDTTPKTEPQNIDWPAKYHMPAVKLARMAIDKTVQSKGYGRALVDFAIAHVKEHVARHVGCRLIITDSKKSAIGFYQKLGFVKLDTPANEAQDAPVMFLVLTKL